MLKLKYIIIDDILGVIFHGGIEHKVEANGRNVTSAGFCKLFPNGNSVDIECYGRSNSLSIGSLPKDSLVLKAMLKNNEMLVS